MKYLITVSALIGLLMPATARDTDFRTRYETLTKGNIKIIGDNVINHKEKGTSPNDPYDDRPSKAKLNDEFDIQYIDVDNDPNTLVSDTTHFSYDGTGGKVAHAGLYWAVTYPCNSGVLRDIKNIPTDKNREEASSVLLKTPDIDTYTPILGELIYDGINDKRLKNVAPYIYYTNVISLLVPATKMVGDYTVVNVRAASEQTEGGSTAGWALVIVYEDSDSNVKKITTYDGFPATTNEEPKTFSSRGFKTPREDDPKTRIVGATLEDDLNMMGDNVSVTMPESGKTISLESEVRPAQNFSSSSINVNNNLVTQCKPANLNTLGSDLFRMDIKSENRHLILNSAISLDLNYIHGRDRYSLFLTALETENNPKEVTRLYRSTRVTKLTAKDTEKGYYVIAGVPLNTNNVNERVEGMKGSGYDTKVYYDRDRVLSLIYVDRLNKCEDAVKKVEETRENIEISDSRMSDIANYKWK